MLLVELIRDLGWAALVLLGLILGARWLLPIVLDQLLRRDLEKFKIETQARHDQEIERLRGDLRVTAFEH